MIIFSVFNSYNDYATNLKQHQGVIDYLNAKSIKFTQVIGYYKKDKELSFIIDDKDREEVEHIFSTYNQDSILHIDENRYATLLYNNGIVESVGRWSRVSIDRAQQYDSFTYNPETQQAFICE